MECKHGLDTRWCAVCLHGPRPPRPSREPPPRTGGSPRRVRTYQPGVHLALRTEAGYRPAVVIRDNGEGEPMVKVRCTVNGVVQDRWVYRVDLIPPPESPSRCPS